MGWHPDPALVMIVEIGAVNKVMGSGLLVNPRAIAEPHMTLGRVVVNELSGSGNDPGRVGIEAAGSGHGVGAVIVHV